MSLLTNLPITIHDAVVASLDAAAMPNQLLTLPQKNEATALASKTMREALAVVTAKNKVLLLTQVEDLDGMTFADEVYGEYNVHYLLDQILAHAVWTSVAPMIEELRSETATPDTVRKAVPRASVNRSHDR